MNAALAYLHSFYKDKTLIERLIIYIFFSHFLVKVIHELVLGQWYFQLSPTKQYYFYTLMAIDYAVNWRRYISSRPSNGPTFLLVLLTVVMCVHGIWIGLYRANAPFEIFNDTVPLLVAAFNVYVMSSRNEAFRDFQPERLVKTVVILSFSSIVVGALAVGAGRPSIINAGGGVTAALFMVVTLSHILSIRKHRRLYSALLLVGLLIMLGEMNRTNMAFLVIVFAWLFLQKFIARPWELAGLFALALLVFFVAKETIPPDSRFYSRIEGIVNYDPDERTGAIGERAAEEDAVNDKLRREGWTADLLGLGHGGVYTVHQTWRVVEDTGHAHFGWALFRLRYGDVGYAYLAAYVLLIAVISVANLRTPKFTRNFSLLIALISLLYVPTWFTFNIMLAGMQFMDFRMMGSVRRRRVLNNVPPRRSRDQPAEGAIDARA